MQIIKLKCTPFTSSAQQRRPVAFTDNSAAGERCCNCRKRQPYAPLQPVRSGYKRQRIALAAIVLKLVALETAGTRGMKLLAGGSVRRRP
jgi:hypothetical protein